MDPIYGVPALKNLVASVVEKDRCWTQMCCEVKTFKWPRTHDLGSDLA